MICDTKQELRNACSIDGQISRAERAMRDLADDLDALRELGGARAIQDIDAAELLIARLALQLDEAIKRTSRLRDSMKAAAGTRALQTAATPVTYQR